MIKLNRTYVLALAALVAPAAYADQGSFSNSGGSGSGGSGIYLSSNVAAPAGTLSLSCPGTGPATCAGGSYNYVSTDGTTTIQASFTSGRYAEGCSGGGKGGHVSCSFSLSGSFSGTLTVNGVPQAINGVTSQAFSSTGSGVGGISAYNSAYTPFYYSDSGSIYRADDLQGTNQVSFSAGFYGAYGIALDAAGRIYVADTYNCRIVRFDDMNGTNLTVYGGTCGSGPGNFYNPSGIAVGADGKIYIMDSGNSQLVRIDDMTGANWIAYGSLGSGMGQFAQYGTSLAVDAAGHIYVADTGNQRLVRIDDMTGANWATLTQSPAVNGVSYSFSSPTAVALDSIGRIYVTDNEYYQPAVIRVDDMTGANWTSVYTGSGSGLNSISIDPTGIVLLGGGGARILDNMSGVLTSSGSIGPVGSYYVFGVTAIPLPNPRPSAIRFTPSTLSFSQNVGTSGSQPLAITNFGGSPLNLSGISTGGGFSQTNNCPAQLPAGSSCTIAVVFAPTATGQINGVLTVSDDAGNAGTSQAVTLTALATAPAASLSPASLNFSSQVANTSSTARTVTMQDTGTGPMKITSVTTTGPFSQTNTCAGATLASGATCTVSVTFTPTAIGSASGTLTFVDDAGTQSINLTGTGTSTATFSSTQLEFGTVVVGSTSSAQSVTLTNRGATPLGITSIAASSSFSVLSTTCTTSLAAGAGCSVSVTFTPAATGDITGALTFTDGAANSPQVVTLVGTGSAPVTVSASTLSFGSIVVGNTSSAKSVTISNRQTVALNFSRIAASAGFAISSNSCGASLATGASCSVAVTFSPTATGSATGTLRFTDDAATSPQNVNLSGTGTAAVTFSASSLSLGTVTVGKTSSAKSVTLTNHLSGALSFSSIAASAGFAISSNTCGAAINAGANCVVAVTFTPTATGGISGALTFTDSAGTQTVTLTGTGN